MEMCFRKTKPSITWGGKQQKHNIFLLIVKKHLLGRLDFQCSLILAAFRGSLLDFYETKAGPVCFLCCCHFRHEWRLTRLIWVSWLHFKAKSVDKCVKLHLRMTHRCLHTKVTGFPTSFAHWYISTKSFLEHQIIICWWKLDFDVGLGQETHICVLLKTYIQSSALYNQ